MQAIFVHEEVSKLSKLPMDVIKLQSLNIFSMLTTMFVLKADISKFSNL